jgi:hypothetical protein
MFARTIQSLALALAATALSSSTAAAYGLTGYDWTAHDNPIEEPFVFRSNGWPGGTDTDEMEDAFVAAMDVWSDQASADIAYIDGGTTTSSSWTYDAQNVGQYTSSTPDTAVALAQYWADGGGNIIDCDIRFYGSNATGSIDWSGDEDGPGNWEIDFQIVAEHELGHCLGLDHSSVSSAIMYPSVTNGTSASDRDLHSDDIGGVQAIYGEVFSADLAYYDHDVDTDDGDQQVEAGEDVSLDLGIWNRGSGTARDVGALLSTDSSVVSLIDDYLEFGDIDEDEVAEASGGKTFELRVSSSCDRDMTVSFDLTIDDDDGEIWTDSFELEVSCADVDSEEDSSEDEGDDPEVDSDVCDDGQELLTWYYDADGDGFGDSELSVQACEPPTDYVANPKDCLDLDSDVFPGADGWTQGCVQVGEEAKAGCATVQTRGGLTGLFLAMGLLLPLSRRR